MIFYWKCPHCKAENESEFKNIRQCQCGKCGFISFFRESDFAFLSYVKSFEEKQIQEEPEPCKIDFIENNLGE
jgi:hypothetical protein|nr:MAG TPA: DNA-directed RNA polymerase [Caudoviricetes sp.]